MRDYLHGTSLLVGAGSPTVSLGSVTPFSAGLFVVDRKTRGTDAQGEGTYELHGIGDASVFIPGGSLYTPDGIVWDIVAVDPDKRGLTVSKRRDDVSLTAWLSGDWSTLSGSVPVREPSSAHEAAMSVRKGAHDVEEGAKSFVKYLPWVIGGAFAIGFVGIAASSLAPLLMTRLRR